VYLAHDLRHDRQVTLKVLGSPRTSPMPIAELMAKVDSAKEACAADRGSTEGRRSARLRGQCEAVQTGRIPIAT
jgi:hypothetical protein